MSDRSSCEVWCAAQDAALVARDFFGEKSPNDCEEFQTTAHGERAGVCYFNVSEVAGGGYSDCEDWAKDHPDIPLIVHGGAHYAYDASVGAVFGGVFDYAPATVDGHSVVMVNEETGEPDAQHLECSRAWAKLRSKTWAAINARAQSPESDAARRELEAQS